MKTSSPIDYQAALDQFQRNEFEPDTPVQSSAVPEPPPMADGYVDYPAAVKAWDAARPEGQAIRMQNRKRNPSHDPERA